jgi:hypothetical protein
MIKKWVWGTLMWQVISSAHNLTAVVQTVRRKPLPVMPTSHNIEHNTKCDESIIKLLTVDKIWVYCEM